LARSIRPTPPPPPITALYTYGDTGQNDRLYFNGVQYGGDDVAQWNTSIANYGPSVVSFNVLTKFDGDQRGEILGRFRRSS